MTRVEGNNVFARELAAIQPELFGFCSALLPFSRPEDADDLVQDVNLAIVERSAQWDSSRPLRPWAFGIAKNLAKMRLRTLSRSRVVFDGELAEKAAEVLLPEGEAAGQSALQRLRYCLSKLPKAQRELLELRYGKGMAPAKIAALMQMDATSAKNKLAYARAKLADCMKGLCTLTDDAFERLHPEAADGRLAEFFGGASFPEAKRRAFVRSIAESETLAREYFAQAFVHSLLSRRHVRTPRKTIGRRIWPAALLALGAVASPLLFRKEATPTIEKTTIVKTATGDENMTVPRLALAAAAIAPLAIAGPSSSSSAVNAKTVDTASIAKKETQVQAKADTVVRAKASATRDKQFSSEAATGTVIMLFGN